MKYLRELEEKDDIKLNSQKIRSFQMEINKVFDNNLDTCLDEFINKNNLEDTDIEYWLREYNVEVKKSEI